MDDGQLSRLLEPGESIVWVGAPDPKVIFAPQDVVLVPTSVFVLVAGAFVFVGSSLAGAPWMFVALTGAFFAVAVYAAVGRFLYKRIDRRRTVYLITDRRAVMARKNGSAVQSVPIGERPNRGDLRADGKRGVVRWAAMRSPESLGQLVSFRRQYGWAAGTYWPGGVDPADLSFWDVSDFDAIKKALSDRTPTHGPPS